MDKGQDEFFLRLSVLHPSDQSNKCYGKELKNQLDHVSARVKK